MAGRTMPLEGAGLDFEVGAGLFTGFRNGMIVGAVTGTKTVIAGEGTAGGVVMVTSVVAGDTEVTSSEGVSTGAGAGRETAFVTVVSTTATAGVSVGAGVLRVIVGVLAVAAAAVVINWGS